MPKILVIDDSAFYRQVVRGFLEEAGYEVEDFLPDSALQVLEKTKACEPDLVLTDYNMPHVDGLEVVRMVRRHGPSLPVIVLTATHDPMREVRLEEHMPIVILHKPIKGEGIVEAVKAILAP